MAHSADMGTARLVSLFDVLNSLDEDEPPSKRARPSDAGCQAACGVGQPLRTVSVHDVLKELDAGTPGGPLPSSCWRARTRTVGTQTGPRVPAELVSTRPSVPAEVASTPDRAVITLD